MKWKNLLSVKAEILGLLVNRFTANYEYSRSSRDNLLLLGETRLSEKLNIFCEFFVPFSESTLSFEYFETRKKFYNSVISEDIDSERRAYLDA